MNSKNQAALHYKFLELHSRNQFVIFAYTKSLLIVSFYYFKKPLYLQNYLKFVHLCGWTERKSSIHWSADKHLQHLLINSFNYSDFKLENQLQTFAFVERSLLHLSYSLCSPIYQSQMWWYARYPHTLSLEFSEDILHAHNVHHPWGWLFLWRNSQSDHKSSLFCLRLYNGLLANYMQDK